MKSSLQYTVLYKYNDNHFKCIVSVNSLLESELLKHYDRQRPPNPERIQQLVVHFNNNLRKYGEPKFLGDVVICQKMNNLVSFQNDSPHRDEYMYIIDGQHRFAAISELIKTGVLNDFLIPVEVLLVQNDAEIQQNYHNINQSVPVPMHYHTPDELIDRVGEILLSKYPDGISTKCRVNRPKISLDKLKDGLLDKDNEKILSKFQTAEELVQAIENLNTRYSRKLFSTLSKDIARGNKEQERILKKAYEKCRKDNKYMYLGLSKNVDWILELK